MSYQRYFATEPELMAFAGRLSTHIKPGTVIFLQGDLGAGKTTFVRGFLRGLNFAGKVKSPTYQLVEHYQIGSQDLYHFDLYRLNSSYEWGALGFDEHFNAQTICLIEWPERIPALRADLMVSLEYEDDGRCLIMQANTAAMSEILALIEEF